MEHELIEKNMIEMVAINKNDKNKSGANEINSSITAIIIKINYK